MSNNNTILLFYNSVLFLNILFVAKDNCEGNCGRYFFHDPGWKSCRKKEITWIQSYQIMSDSLWPHESQHARPPCPSPTPGVHSDPRPSSQWCHPAISSSVIPFSSCPQSLPASVFSNESTLRMRWPKYWSFSFSITLLEKRQPKTIMSYHLTLVRMHIIKKLTNKCLRVWRKGNPLALLEGM